jgi:hypothetical protein
MASERVLVSFSYAGLFEEPPRVLGLKALLVRMTRKYCVMNAHMEVFRSSSCLLATYRPASETNGKDVEHQRMCKGVQSFHACVSRQAAARANLMVRST